MVSKADSEQALACHVVGWLRERCWDVFEEVQPHPHGRVADIVAVRDPDLWVIECKRSLNLTVLAQAHQWKALRRSIAVPRPQRRARRDPVRDFVHRACRELGVGLLEIGRTGEIYETIPAPLLRWFRNHSRNLRSRLHDGHKSHARAGSPGGGHWTPYREVIDRVREFVALHPGCTLDEILLAVAEHPGSRSLELKPATIGTALRSWEAWCFVDESRLPARYFLTNDRPALEQAVSLFASA